MWLTLLLESQCPENQNCGFTDYEWFCQWWSLSKLISVRFSVVVVGLVVCSVGWVSFETFIPKTKSTCRTQKSQKCLRCYVQVQVRDPNSFLPPKTQNHTQHNGIFLCFLWVLNDFENFLVWFLFWHTGTFHVSSFGMSWHIFVIVVLFSSIQRVTCTPWLKSNDY